MAYPAAKSGFTLEDLTKMGPDEITRKRKLAEALLAESQGIRRIEHPLQGMAQMAQALVGNLKQARLDRAESEGKAGANALFSAGMGMGEFPPAPGGGGAASASSSPAVNPNVADGPKGQESYAAAPTDIREGIAQTAQALGIDPVDLATAISYETGGTFDPKQGGPTTKWGKHRGLIQFGEPQARQFGVDWNNPVASQLGPDGAVAKYLRSTGVKPGMKLLDIYSAINAGGVGRYGASDTAAGGAPGNVRDKVENQMAAHRAKALAMFGGQSPDGGAQALEQMATGQPAQVASLDPSIGVPPAAPAPNQAAIAQALIEQGIDPNGPQAQAFASLGAGGGAPAAANPALFVPGVSDQGLSVQPIPNATPLPAGVDPATLMDPAAQGPLPTQPGAPAAQAPLPQQQQMAQALINDPAQTLGAPAIQPGGPDMGTLMNMAGNEFMSPGQQRMIEALTGRRMEREAKQSDPAYQMDLERKRLELDKLRRGDPSEAMDLETKRLQLEKLKAGDPMDALQQEKARLEIDKLKRGEPSDFKVVGDRLLKTDPDGVVTDVTPGRAGQTPGEFRFSGNSVEAQALNGLIDAKQLTPEQAMQVAAGKTITGPNGEMLFLTPQGIFQQDQPGGPAVPVTPPTAAPSAPAAPATLPSPTGIKTLTGPKEPTVDEKKAMTFADRMTASGSIIDQMGTRGSGKTDKLLSEVPMVSEYLTSPEFKKLDQAKRDFINAQLRRESGAVISNEEFDNANKQYFPQPNDPPEVLGQKRKNREVVIKGMVRDSGPTYKPAGAPAGKDALKKKYNLD